MFVKIRLNKRSYNANFSIPNWEIKLQHLRLLSVLTVENAKKIFNATSNSRYLHFYLAFFSPVYDRTDTKAMYTAQWPLDDGLRIWFRSGLSTRLSSYRNALNSSECTAKSCVRHGFPLSHLSNFVLYMVILIVLR